MFEITPDQAKVLEALLSPFGLILHVQAGKWLARQLGAEITVVHIRAFLGGAFGGVGLCMAGAGVATDPILR